MRPGPFQFESPLCSNKKGVKGAYLEKCRLFIIQKIEPFDTKTQPIDAQIQLSIQIHPITVTGREKEREQQQQQQQIIKKK